MPQYDLTRGRQYIADIYSRPDYDPLAAMEESGREKPKGYASIDQKLGGWLPFGGTPSPITKGNVLDPNQPSTPIGGNNLFNQLSQGLTKGASFGLLQQGGTFDRGISKLLGLPEPVEVTPTTTAQKAAHITGDILGAALPISKLYSAGRAIAPAAGVGRTLVPGAIAGGGYEGIRSTAQGDPLPIIARNVALGGALGGGGDVALRAAAPVARNLFSTPKGALQRLDMRDPVKAGMAGTPPPRATRSGGTSELVAPARPNAMRFLPEDRTGAKQLINNMQRPPQNFSFLRGITQPPGNAIQPIEQRTFNEVGKRSVNAYMHDNQQVKPYIQTEANRLLGELSDTIKGQRTYTEFEGESFFGGVKRFTSDPITRIKDETGASYVQIGDALNKLVHNKGLENNALSKKIELVIDDNLTYGTKDITGFELPPVDEYVRAKSMGRPITQQDTADLIGNFRNRSLPQPKTSQPRSGFLAEPETTMPAAMGDTSLIPAMPKTMAEARENPFTMDVRLGAPRVSRMGAPQVRGQQATGAGTAESFRSKINRQNKNKTSFKDVYNNLRTHFIDDLDPLERVEKSVRGKISSAEDSLYKTARLFRGAPTKAHEIIRTGLNPIISSIEKQGFNYKDMGDYALAIHARDVNAAGLNSGFTDAEINAVISKYGQALEPARRQLMGYNDSLLKELANAGVVDNSLVGTLKQKWPNYMPLFRNMDDGKVGFSNGLSKALVNATSPIKRLQGSDRQVLDPIEGLVKNTFQTVNAAERNRVAQQVAMLAKDDPTGQFVKRLPADTNRERLNTVYVRENGEKAYYQVQPDVYKALMNLDKEGSNFLIKLLQKPASVLRAGATLTPEFSFRNPMRDVVQAYATSKSGFNPLVDFPVAFFDAMTKGKGLGPIKVKNLYSQFLKDNAGYGNIISMDRDVHREALKTVLKESPGKKFVNIISGRSLIRLLRGISDLTETSTKMGEYRAALRSGASRPEAAYRARDLMDFSRSGSSIRETNKIIAFINSNLQGKSRIIRSIRENPVRFTVKAITAVTLPTVGEYLAQKYLANDKQKQIIADAPPWLKNTFWLLPVPNTEQVARIPKPFDLAIPFSNLPRRMMEYMDTKDPAAFDNFARESFSAASIPVMITGLTPFLEGMANYSFFRQGPIIPQRDQDINFPDQYDIHTSEVAKATAKGINKITGGQGPLKNFGSPRVVDNTIRGLTAGLGTLATGAIDQVAESTGIVDKKKKPARKPSEIPIAKAFLVSDTGTGHTMDQLYKLRDTLTREKGSASAKKEPFKQVGKLKYVNNMTERIGNINKQMRTIENNPNINSVAKRQRLDKLNETRNQLARQAMERLKKWK